MTRSDVNSSDRKIKDSSDAPRPTRHTVAGIALNLILLAAIGYGYARSESWKWAWALVAAPIIVVTLNYVRHLLGDRSK